MPGTPSSSRGGFAFIAAHTLAVAAASLDVQNIPPAYTHLQVWLLVRSTDPGTEDYVELRFNNDSGANYDYANFNHRSSGATSASGDAAVDAFGAGAFSGISFCPAGGSPAGAFGSVVVEIPFYAGDKRKTYLARGSSPDTDAAAGHFGHVSSGEWRNAAVVSRVTALPQFGPNWLAGSSMFVYGIG